MFKSLFGFLAGLVKKAFQAAEANGLTDQAISQALGYARLALSRFADDAQRRDWVVAKLVGGGMKESIARFAVEAAVQLLKRELAG